MNDPYTTLGVPFGTNPEDCKAAFRALAKTCHPDLHPNDAAAEARFKEINAAYNEITNPSPEPQQFQSGPRWRNFNFNFDPAGHSPFEDLFTHLRGGPLNITTHEVRLSLEEAFRGKEIVISVPSREIKVMVPAGVEDGMRLVVQQGGPRSQTQTADVHILIRILPHPRITRHGMNLSTIMPVTAFDVLLGNEIEVVGIDGNTMRVAIPSNFDSTRKLRLAGQGMMDARGARGDLLVDLFVQYPAVPPEQLETLRNIARESATWI